MGEVNAGYALDLIQQNRVFFSQQHKYSLDSEVSCLVQDLLTHVKDPKIQNDIDQLPHQYKLKGPNGVVSLLEEIQKALLEKYPKTLIAIPPSNLSRPSDEEAEKILFSFKKGSSFELIQSAACLVQYEKKQEKKVDELELKIKENIEREFPQKK